MRLTHVRKPDHSPQRNTFVRLQLVKPSFRDIINIMIYYSLSIIYYLSFIIYYLVFIIYYLFFVGFEKKVDFMRVCNFRRLLSPLAISSKARIWFLEFVPISSTNTVGFVSQFKLCQYCTSSRCHGVFSMDDLSLSFRAITQIHPRATTLVAFCETRSCQDFINVSLK